MENASHESCRIELRCDAGIFSPQLVGLLAALLIKQCLHSTLHYDAYSTSFDYKILTKPSTNRLKGVINSFVEPDQTGFIPWRLIQTNFSTVRDLIHGGNKVSKWGADFSGPEEGLRPTGKNYPRKGHGLLRKTGTLHQAS